MSGPFAALECTVQWFSDETWDGTYVHVYVCLFACVLGREVYKEKKKMRHPTLEWELVFVERCQKNYAIYLLREMLPNKM